MGGALHWKKLGGVLDDIGVAKGDKSGGCRDVLFRRVEQGIFRNPINQRIVAGEPVMS